MGNSGEIDNRAVFTATGDNTVFDPGFGGSGAKTIVNTGVFQKTGGAGTTTVSVRFENKTGGVVDGRSGTINFNGSGSTTQPIALGGTFTANGGFVDVTGTLFVDTAGGSITATGVRLNGGTINGSGNLTVQSGGTLEWRAGTMT